MGFGITLNVTRRGINQTTKKLSPEALLQAGKDSLEESLLELQDLARSYTPTNTGGTASRIGIDANFEGTTLSELNGIVYSPDSYFKVLEYGRRPGATMPPEGPIRTWMEDKGIDTEGKEGKAVLFLIRRAIGRRGLPAHHIMQRALDRGRTHFSTIFINRFLKDWND
jgi:hypothetical protein